MHRNRFVALILVVAGSPVAAQQPIAIRDVTVIDGTGGAVRAHQTVLLRGERIWRVDSATRKIPTGFRVVDGRNLYLVPGFIDVHAHYSIGPVAFDTSTKAPTLTAAYDPRAAVEMLRTLVAFGITTIRNPGGPTRESVALRDSVRLGFLEGPRILTAGDVIDASAIPGLVTTVRNDVEVRNAVRRQAAEGVDYVKLYALLGPDMIRAGVDEAHRNGVRAIGHLFATTWTDAARSGIDGIVHIAPGTPALLPADQRPAFRGRLRGTQFMLEWFHYVDTTSAEITEMTEALRQNQVFLDPTLVTFEAMAWGDSARIMTSADLELAPPSLVAGWRRFNLTLGWKPEDYVEARKAWPKVLGYTKYLWNRGVPLTVGTDMANAWTVPGASFHREMELLVAAGIPTLEVLRLATRNGARSLGIESEVGTIAPGKIADMVLLAGDPVADIRNTRAIAWVVQRGRMSQPSDLLPLRLRGSAARPRGVPVVPRADRRGT